MHVESGGDLRHSLVLHHQILQEYLLHWGAKQEEIIRRYANGSAAWQDASGGPEADAGGGSSEEGQVASGRFALAIEISNGAPRLPGRSNALQAMGLSENDTKSMSAKFEQAVETYDHFVEKVEEPHFVIACAVALINHRVFHFICSLIIFCNAIFLAYTTEQGVQKLSSGHSPRWWATLELCFLGFYMLELGVKLVAERRRFFWGLSTSWNLFDSLLVILSLNEVVTSTAQSHGRGENMSYLRVIRLFKMLKLLRVIRILRSFRELRLVLNAILGSLNAIVWTLLLIMIVAFMFAICFVQAITSCLLQPEGPCTEDVDEALFHWGSITSAMIALFKASTGGDDWGNIVEPLRLAGDAFYGIFMLYIAFFMFVVTNAICSIFVDSTIAYSSKDEDAVIQEHLSKKQEYMAKVTALFHLMVRSSGQDADGDGVTLEVFMSHMNDRRLLAFAETLDIEATDLEQFFMILSGNGKRLVDLETFVVGCIKLRGMAKSMDMMEVIMSMKKFEQHQEQLTRQHKDFAELCTDQFSTLRSICARAAVTEPARETIPLTL